MRPDGNCRTCMVEIKGERVLAPSCCRYPTDGMEVTTDSARAVDQPEDGARVAALGRAGDRPTRSIPSSICWARKLSVGKPRFAARHQPVRGRLAPGDRGEPRRLHPVRPLRARLPRRTGQRRHRLRLPRRGLEDRVRPRRSDGRFHLCRLRRMRPGVSDRRAHARARGREDRGRQAGGVGLPVLRRRMPAHLPRQGQPDSLRAGQGRSCELEPTVRQGPLRLRLRAAQASPDEAADSQAWRGQAQGLHRRSGQLERRLPRSHLGGGARLRRQRLARRARHATARSRWPASARRRARTKRPTCSRSWCARDSARTTSITARGSATPRASRR